MKKTTTTHADDKPASDKPARPRKKVVTAGDLVGLRVRTGVTAGAHEDASKLG